MKASKLLEILDAAHTLVVQHGITLEAERLAERLAALRHDLERPYAALTVLDKLCIASIEGRVMDRTTDPDISMLWVLADRAREMPFLPETPHSDFGLVFEERVADERAWYQGSGRCMPKPGDLVQVWRRETE